MASSGESLAGPRDKGDVEASRLPGIIDGPMLGRRSVDFARSLPSYTKGQLAYYSRIKGKINPKDVDAILEGDGGAREEYGKLEAQEATLVRGDHSLKLGTAVVGVELQAYQPRVNRSVVRKTSDLAGVYSLAGSTIQGNEFIDRVKEFVSQTPSPNESGGAVTYFGEFVRNTLIQIVVMGEMLTEKGVASPLTLTMPETTFRLVRQFYPNVFERVRRAHESGALDVGLSNAHHTIAPLLSKDDLHREYSHSLEYYLKHFKPRDGKVCLHIPEQAKTGDLLEVLTKVQKDHGVKFIVCFDSNHHNDGFDISRAVRFQSADPPVDLTAFFRAFNACDTMAFKVTNRGDPLSDDERAKRDPSGLNPEREEGWANQEAKRLFGLFACDLFGTNREQAIWRDPLYEGRDSAIILANDAEFIGLHHPGEGYPFLTFLETLGDFGIKTASFHRTLDMVGAATESQKRPHDASWSGGFGLWINPRTQWLRDIVGGTLSEYNKPLLEATALLSKHNTGMKEKDLPRELSAAWENYGLSLISCPYWWSGWEADYPNNVPVIPELFRNIASCGKDLDTMLSRMIETPGRYGLPAAEIDGLKAAHAKLREADGRFRESPAARQYGPLKDILDNYRRLD
ncbi:MAG: hypothetical protein V1875_08215 [Candidatus Altiarchaeota archaeon]